MIQDMIEQYIGQGFPCLFHLLTGLYCPGCGGTRAILALLRGDIIGSFKYHPLILYIVVVTVVVTIAWLISRIKKRPSLIVKRIDLFVYIGIGVILVNWLYKNYMLLAKGVALLLIGAV